MVGKRTEDGYVALIAVLIVGAAATAIALTLLLVGTDSQRSTLAEQQNKQARALAIACGQEALQQIHDNVAFSTTSGSLSLGQGSCTYTVTITSPVTRIVTGIGTVGTLTKKVQTNATIGATTATIGTWQEVPLTYRTIAHVQSANLTNDTGAATIVQPFAVNVTAGSLIVAAMSWDTSSGSTVTCSDTRSNAYTTLNVWNDATNTQSLAICYAPNSSAGADTVTATLGAGAGFRRMIISEYSGVATSSPVDVSLGIGGVAGAAAATSGSVTPTQNGDLIYGAIMDTGTITPIAPGAGFTQRSFTNVKDLATQDFQQLTAAAVAATFTQGTAQRYNAAVVAFKPATY
jgi:hypothetical protein